MQHDINPLTTVCQRCGKINVDAKSGCYPQHMPAEVLTLDDLEYELGMLDDREREN